MQLQQIFDLDKSEPYIETIYYYNGYMILIFYDPEYEYDDFSYLPYFYKVINWTGGVHLSPTMHYTEKDATDASKEYLDNLSAKDKETDFEDGDDE